MTNNFKNWMEEYKALSVCLSLICRWSVAFQRFLRKKGPSLEWWSQRIASGILVPMIVILMIITISGISSAEGITLLSFMGSMFESSTIILFILTLVVGFHAEHGMCEVVKDYVHSEKLKIVSYFMIRVLTLECIKFVYFGYLVI